MPYQVQHSIQNEDIETVHGGAEGVAHLTADVEYFHDRDIGGRDGFCITAINFDSYQMGDLYLSEPQTRQMLGDVYFDRLLGIWADEIESKFADDGHQIAAE